VSEEPTLVLRDVELRGARADVTCSGGRITAIAAAGSTAGGDEVLDAAGGALLPGLHDHHIHLLATAAARLSVDCSTISDAAALADALRGAGRPGSWVRAVGYHESLAGPLDRTALDRLVDDRPVRVQHATGGLWILNTAAVEAADLEAAGDVDGIERDAAGRATGRLWRRDEWLRSRVPGHPVDLRALGADLAALGVTGVTDTTPTTDPGPLRLLAGAAAAGDLPQRLVVTGGPGLPPDVAPELARGPVKLALADHDLPPLDELVAAVRAAHRSGRAVAVHCVTAEALVLTLAALRDAGPHPGDRVEHGAVVLPGQHAELAALGVTVVTQPGMVRARGDRYLLEVDQAERPHLWPCRSLLDAGVAVAAGSDAPYGPLDPWVAVDAAATRTTAAGAALGPQERVSPLRALGMFLAPLEHPGGPPRLVARGAPADLCLLDRPLEQVLAAPDARHVRATVIGGRVVRALG
jgi:predicted amidohydrolase YtcJ